MGQRDMDLFPTSSLDLGIRFPQWFGSLPDVDSMAISWFSRFSDDMGGSVWIFFNVVVSHHITSESRSKNTDLEILIKAWILS